MPLVEDIGHIVLEVADMDAAVRLYRDVLGFTLPAGVNPVWTVAATKGGSITLYRVKTPVPLILTGKRTPISLHVQNFEESAEVLERAGYRVMRESPSAGAIMDPWGNDVGLHDHRNE